ncbi:O-linked GlcNAc transferase [hydrothermal vent metagenome]|uniref:O-linked GlcNAc transferase n=1 Tax=hydrothermal vent metagenome TaxID=652676 RepID=A0A1W1BQ73_9ZZZZ
MSTFQLLLLVLAGAIFYLFFKQLFSGSFPKRGVDFEAKRADEQIGGINRPDKTFSTPAVQLTRMEQLLKMADTAIAKEDLQEAEKALQSALILDENSIEALQRIGYVAMQQKKYQEAKEYFEKILSLDESDDMAHASLANALHQLGDEEGAKQHHERAIALDPEYAPHHFNYANTLYDLGCKEEALIEYKKAFALDSELEVAKKMIKELSE